MGKGPGLFSDIGKKTRDLLYEDYTCNQRFIVSTEQPNGLTFITSGTKEGEAFHGELTTRLKKNNVETDVKVDTDSNILTTVTVDEAAPGLKTIFSFAIPDQRSGKAEVQYLHDVTGFSLSIGMSSAPVVQCSGVVGSKEFALGGEAGFDTATGSLTKYNTGFSFMKPDFITSVILTDKCETLRASYLHTVNRRTNSTVAAEIAHNFSKDQNTFTVGGLYKLDDFTSVKARLDNHLKLAGLIQHEWRPKSLITISGEIDTRFLDQSARVGLALSLKP